MLNFISKVGACPPPIAKRRAISALGLGVDRDSRAMRRLRDVHKGERAFVIGNGPSLRMRDLEKLRDEVSFGSNKIHLAFSETEWRPTYHILENDIVVKELAEVIPQWSHQVILSYDGLRHMPRYERILYFTRDFYTNPVNPQFQFCPLGHVHMGYSVLYSALQFAHFFGIREIYLLGVDFSYSFSERKKPKEIGKTQMYESSGESNHFHPDYKKQGEAWYDPNLDYQLLAFKKAKEVFEKSRGRIYNATRGGKLEIFERVDFDSLF